MAGKTGTRNTSPITETFTLSKNVANPSVLTALRGRGEYSGGSWNNAGSLLNDYFIHLTNK
jgi:hypothetical protein